MVWFNSFISNTGSDFKPSTKTKTNFSVILLILPSIILHQNDCMIVPYRLALPNFVTNSNISADYVIINNNEKIDINTIKENLEKLL